MSKGFSSNGRMVLLATGILLCFCGIGARLVFLHVLQRDELLKEVERARRSFVVESARRGDILAVGGQLLASSHTLVEVGVDPQSFRREDEARLPELARLLKISLADVRAAAALRLTDAPEDRAREERAVQWVKLTEGVEEDVYERVMELGIRGVYGNRTYRRTYPNRELAAHLIGYINRDGVPAAGVERHMDLYLHGVAGWRESERDGRRRELAQFRTREVQPSDGYDVVLSLDLVVQYLIEEELQRIAREFSPAKATIIVSDVRTGFILGLANYPTFNPNEFNRAPMAALRNIAVTDVLEPGSTFKIVAASAALEEGLATPESVVDCSVDEVEYRGRRLRLPADDHALGQLTVAGIVSHSSNRGAARLGLLLGERRLYDYARKFGFGEITGFPFGGEVDGMLPPPEKWDGLTITRMPMGHAVSATPLQIHTAMAAIANGGVLLRPRIVRQVRDAGGGLIFDFSDQVRHRVISERTAQTMARLLRDVASPRGTAPEAAIRDPLRGYDYEIAGKTGTTQKLIDGRYSSEHHIGSFVGFFPATRPRVVVSVIVDDANAPDGGTAYGRVVAVPPFRRIAERLIQYLDIKPVAKPLIEPARNRFVMQASERPEQGVRW